MTFQEYFGFFEGLFPKLSSISPTFWAKSWPTDNAELNTNEPKWPAFTPACGKVWQYWGV